MADFVVIQDIPFGTVYAYRVGDLITADAVRRNGWEDYVKPRDSIEAAPPRGPFDPANYTEEQVQEYLAEADEAERKRVLDAERDGKSRARLLVGTQPVKGKEK